MRTLTTMHNGKKILLFATAMFIASLAMAQDLLVKNPAGYQVNLGGKAIQGGRVADGKAVVAVLFDVTALATAKTAKDTAAAWEKISKDASKYYAVSGTVKSINESSFQLVTAEKFAVDFAGKNLSLFFFSNPDNKPAGTVVIQSIGLKECCAQSCMGRRGFYQTLTRCLSGKGYCQTCVNCCFPIMSVN